MNRGSNRLYLLFVVALMVLWVGSAARAAVPLETSPSWHSVDQIRTYDVEWFFATAGTVYPDLYAANIDGPVYVYTNSAVDPITISSTPATVSAVSENAVDIDFGDFDNDGFNDMALVLDNGRVEVYHGTTGTIATDWTLVWQSCQLPTANTIKAKWAYVNGDNLADLITIGDPDYVKVYYSEGAGSTFRLNSGCSDYPDWESPSSYHALSIDVGDIDSDGYDDFVIGTGDGDPIYLFMFDPYLGVWGNYMPNPVWQSADTPITKGVLLRDFDKDLELDLAAGNVGDPTWIYQNTGADPWFPTTPDWASQQANDTFDICAADFDVDSDPGVPDLDLVEGNFGQADVIYANDTTTIGVLNMTTLPVWTSDFATGQTLCIACADIGEDLTDPTYATIDPELAAGDWDQFNVIYLNWSELGPYLDNQMPAADDFCVDIDLDGHLLDCGTCSTLSNIYFQVWASAPGASITSIKVFLDSTTSTMQEITASVSTNAVTYAGIYARYWECCYWDPTVYNYGDDIYVRVNATDSNLRFRSITYTFRVMDPIVLYNSDPQESEVWAASNTLWYVLANTCCTITTAHSELIWTGPYGPTSASLTTAAPICGPTLATVFCVTQDGYPLGPGSYTWNFWGEDDCGRPYYFTINFTVVAPVWPTFRGPGYPTYAQGPLHSGTTPYPAYMDCPSRRWTYREAGDPEIGDFYASPVKDIAGSVYTIDTNHILYKIASSGTLAWSVDTGGAATYTRYAPVLGPGATDNTIVFVPLGTMVRAYQSSNGALLGTYTIPTGNAVRSSLLLYYHDNDMGQPRLAFGTRADVAGDNFYILDASAANLFLEICTYEIAGEHIMSTPAADPLGTSLWVGSHLGYMHKFSATACTIATTFDTAVFEGAVFGGLIHGSPAVATDGSVFFGDDAGFFFKIGSDATIGSTGWYVDTTNTILGSAAIFTTGATLCVTYGDNSGTLWVFGAYQPSAVVTPSDALFTAGPQAGGGSAIFGGPSVSADGYIYFGSQNGRMYCADATQGDDTYDHDLWNIELGDYIQAVPAIGYYGEVDICTATVDGYGGIVVEIISDCNAPSTSCLSFDYLRFDYTNVANFQLRYLGTDYQSGIESIDFYRKPKYGGTYQKIGTAYPPAPGFVVDGVYSTSLTDEGIYHYYTRGLDRREPPNEESAPAGYDCAIVYDATAPEATCATTEEWPTTATLSVYYTAWEDTTATTSVAGLYSLKFYTQWKANNCGASWGTWQAESTHATTYATGTTLANGCIDFVPPYEGYYNFAFVASDWASNSMIEPPVASCSSTVVDYTDPESQTIGCAATNDPVISRAYTASDSVSGLAQLDLYYWYSPDGGASWSAFTYAYTVKTAPDADDTVCVWDGNWTFDVSGIGEGIYRFVTIATDNLGNEETHPTSESEAPYYQIYYDITDPETWAEVSSMYWSYYSNHPTNGTIEVCFDSTFPEPGGSGLEQVTLWWRAQVDCTGSWTAWSDTLTDPVTGPTICSTTATVLTNGCWYFPAATAIYPAQAAMFEFYTIGEDFGGNTESVPPTADAEAMYENIPPESEAYAMPRFANTAVDLGLTSWDDPGTCSSGIATVASLYQYEGEATWSTISGVMIPTSGTVSWLPAPPWEGWYRILSNAQDRAGNWEYANWATLNAQPMDDDFIYDVTSPIATLTCVSPPYLASPATLEYGFTDENASGTTVTGMDYTQLWARDAGTGSLYLVATDASVYGNTGPGTSTFNFYPPYEATFGLYTTGYDRAGNFESGSATECVITFDWTAPTSTITSIIPTVATADPAHDCVEISFIATDSVSGIAELHLFYRYTEDGGATWEPATMGTCGWRDYGLDVPSSIQYGVTSGTISFCFDSLLNGDLDGYYEFYTFAVDGAGNPQVSRDNDGDGCEDAMGGVLRDTTGPWSSAECTENIYPNHIATTAVVEICYEAGDGSGLNLDLVELWFRFYMPYYSTWTHWCTDSTLVYEGAPVATSGVFYFDTLAGYGHGDGIYQFFTLARDEAGNWERMPTYPPRDYDTYLMIDTAPPIASCDVPYDLYAEGPIIVDYVASDELSGISYVELWYATFSTVWTWATAGTISTEDMGTFEFDPTGFDSELFRFYVQAVDGAGHVMAEPSGAVGCGPVALDLDDPTVECDAAEFTMGPAVDIMFIASDATTQVDTVTLWYSFQGADWVDSGVTKENTGGDDPFYGVFTFAPETGEGQYMFRLVVTDLVGHSAYCETTTIFDETKPTTEVTGDDYVIGGEIELILFGEDPVVDSRTVSGIDYVELFYMYSADGDFSGATWMTTGVTTATIDTLGTYTTPPWNPYEGDGWYRFCTRGHDNAGNVEDFPYHYDWELAYESGQSLVTSECWMRGGQQYWTEELIIDYIATPTTTALDDVELWYRYQAYPGATWTNWVNSGYVAYELTGTFTFARLDFGEGLYQFYTHASEISGLEEEHHADPNMRYDCWGHYDVTAPGSFAWVTATFTNASNINVSVDFEDYLMVGGCGVDCIELWYRLEYGTWEHTGCQAVAGGSPQDVIFTATQDGLYEFYSIAVDKAGNTEGNPTDRDGTIIRDTLEPWAIASCASATNDQLLTVTYTADDTVGSTTNISELDTVRLYYMFAANGSSWPGAWTDTGMVSTTGAFDFTLANGQGVYRFYAEATDHAGNVETFNGAWETQCVYDTLAPSSSATSPTFATEPIVDVTYNSSEGQSGSIMPSGLAVTELWYRFQDPATSEWTGWMDSGLRGAGATGTIEFDIDLFGYGEGLYQFYTIAVDNAGNREAAPAVADDSTTVAITAPASMVMDELTADYCNDGTIEAFYEATSPVAAITDVALWYRYSADGTLWSGWSEAVEATRYPTYFAFVADVVPVDEPDGVTDEGYYEFYTIASDEAGNVEEAPLTADASVLTDITDPESSVDVPACTSLDQILVHFNADDSLSGLARVELEVATVPTVWAPTGLFSTQTSGVMLFEPPEEGTYYLTTVSHDKAGNVEGDKDGRAAAFYYDLTAPETTLTRTVVATRSVPIPVDFSVLEEGCGLTDVRLYYHKAGDSLWIDSGLTSTGLEGLFNFVPPGLEQGRYHLAASGTDIAGNVEALPAIGQFDIEVIYDTTAPTTDLSLSVTRLLDDCETIGVTYVATDEHSSILNVTLCYYGYLLGAEEMSWIPYGVLPGSADEFAFTPPEGDRKYYFAFVAEDVAGNKEFASPSLIPAPTDAANPWFMFDSEAPYVVEGFPEHGDVNVPRHSNIDFTVYDNEGGWGVDITTIEVEVVDSYGRNITASSISMDEGDLAGSIHVVFDPHGLFGYEEEITVYVTACDLVPSEDPADCSNCMAEPFEYSFSVAARQAPQLANGSVTPTVGYVPLNTEFTYEVDYLSPTAEAPITKRVYIDGISHEMTLVAGEAWDGTYHYVTSGLEAGVHEYYFLFATAGGEQAREPVTGTKQGPTVDENLATTLTCNVLPANPMVHDTLTIYGTLGMGATEETIQIGILTPVAGAWATSTCITTDGGEYTYQASASVIGPWSVRSAWAGDDDYGPAHSVTVNFDVGRIETELELAVTPQTLRLGETVDITGRLNATPAFTDGVVYLELVNPAGDRSEPVELELLPDGTFEYAGFDMLTLLGTWEIIAVFDGTGEYAPSTSEAVPVVVSGGDAAILIHGYSVETRARTDRHYTAEFVYQTLRRRGLSHDDIHYLSIMETSQYRDATSSRAEYDNLILDLSEQIVDGNAPDNLYVVLIGDMSPNNSFVLREGEGLMHPGLYADLDGLKTLAPSMNVVGVMGFDGSALFAEYLPRVDDSVFISSAGVPDAYTYPEAATRHGDLFIAEFFSAIASDKTIGMAFEMAYDATRVVHNGQEPMIFDSYGLADTMDIGAWTIRGDMAPVIADYAEGTTFAEGGVPPAVELWVQAADDVMVDRAYALLMTMAYDPAGEPFTGASDPIVVTLNRQVGGYWTGSYDMTIPGEYVVAYIAKDNLGNVSQLASTTYVTATLEVEIELNSYTFHPDDTIAISLGYTNNTDTYVDVDLYLALSFPDGSLLCWTGMAAYTLDMATPYYAGLLPPGHWDPSPVSFLPIPADWNIYGDYVWWAVFVEPDTKFNMIGTPAAAAMEIQP